MIAREWWIEEETFPAMGKPTAMVVDDREAGLSATAQVLEKFGFVVFTAGTARDAARIVDGLAGPLDLLVTEATLPDAQGDLLVRLVRLKGQRPAVLFTSGRPRRQLHMEGFRGLSAPILRNPFSDDELATRVRSLLGL